MKNKKETAPTTEKERENFWLEIGPASAYYGTDSYETAKENGDASPDGKARGFEGAEQKAAYDIQNVLHTRTEYGIVFLSRTTVRQKNRKRRARRGKTVHSGEARL